jgi:hypothetical protein
MYFSTVMLSQKVQGWDGLELEELHTQHLLFTTAVTLWLTGFSALGF